MISFGNAKHPPKKAHYSLTFTAWYLIWLSHNRNDIFFYLDFNDVLEQVQYMTHIQYMTLTCFVLTSTNTWQKLSWSGGMLVLCFLLYFDSVSLIPLPVFVCFPACLTVCPVLIGLTCPSSSHPSLVCLSFSQSARLRSDSHWRTFKILTKVKPGCVVHIWRIFLQMFFSLISNLHALQDLKITTLHTLQDIKRIIVADGALLQLPGRQMETTCWSNFNINKQKKWVWRIKLSTWTRLLVKENWRWDFNWKQLYPC